MSQIPVTVKIDASLKQEAQALAKSLGLSLSSIVENKLREVVRERQVLFKENLTPNIKTVKQLNQIEEDVKKRRNLSGPFTTFEELESYLGSLGHEN